MNSKKILSSWVNVLSLFRPNELLQLVFFEWKALKELVIFFIHYLWWAYLLWLGAWGIRVIQPYMFLNITAHLPVTLLMSMLFMALDPFIYFFFIGGMRPSVSNKKFSYFKNLSLYFLSFFLIILSTYIAVFVILYLCSLIHPLMHTSVSFIMSWILLLKMPEGRILLSPMVIFFTFFFLDSIATTVSLYDYIMIFKKTFLFLLYNYPLCVVCALGMHAIIYIFQPYLVSLYTDLLFSKTDHTITVSFFHGASFLYVFLLPLYLIFMNNLYIKLVFKNIDYYK